MAVGAAGLGGVELLGGSGAALSLMQSIGSQGMIVAAGAKFTVAFVPLYHYMGALRHFLWDYMPEKVTNIDAEKSSYYIFAAATAVSGALVFA